MNLPPLDVFRQPLVEPLGHLVLQAAYLDNALYEFIAMLLPFGPDTTVEQVAHRLRNWDSAFIEKSIDDAIPNADLAKDLSDYVQRVGEVRELRHRMIHDAMEVGLDDTPGGGYRAIILREGYQRSQMHRGQTFRTLVRLEPNDVAALAFQFYDLRGEIDEFLGRWRSVGACSD